MQLEKSCNRLDISRDYSPEVSRYPTELISNCKKVATSCKQSLLNGPSSDDLNYIFTKLRICVPMVFSVSIAVPSKSNMEDMGKRVFYNIDESNPDRWVPTPSYTRLFQPPISIKSSIQTYSVHKLLKSKRVNNDDDILLF